MGECQSIVLICLKRSSLCNTGKYCKTELLAALYSSRRFCLLGKERIQADVASVAPCVCRIACERNASEKNGEMLRRAARLQAAAETRSKAIFTSVAQVSTGKLDKSSVVTKQSYCWKSRGVAMR